MNKQGTFQITKNNTNLYSYTLYHKLHVFLLCFVLLFYWAYTRTEFEISKQLFLRVSPRGLCLKKFCTSWRGLYWTTKQGTFQFQITKNNTNLYSYTLYDKVYIFLCFVFDSIYTYRSWNFKGTVPQSITKCSAIVQTSCKKRSIIGPNKELFNFKLRKIALT